MTPRRSSHTSLGSKAFDGAALPSGLDLGRRVVIANVWPSLDDRAFAIKRVEGDRLEVWADILADGHDLLAAVLRVRPAGSQTWLESPMRELDNDRWSGSVELGPPGRYLVGIQAWVDRFGSWRRELRARLDAGQDVASAMSQGRAIVEELLGGDLDRSQVRAWLDLWGDQADGPSCALSDEFKALLDSYDQRAHASVLEPEIIVQVDRQRAAWGAW